MRRIPTTLQKFGAARRPCRRRFKIAYRHTLHQASQRLTTASRTTIFRNFCLYLRLIKRSVQRPTLRKQILQQTISQWTSHSTFRPWRLLPHDVHETTSKPDLPSRPCRHCMLLMSLAFIPADARWRSIAVGNEKQRLSMGSRSIVLCRRYRRLLQEGSPL